MSETNVEISKEAIDRYCYLLSQLHGEFYGKELAHADAFRILPKVVEMLKELSRLKEENERLREDESKPRIVLTLEGENVQQLWSNLNWLLCNAVESKQQTGFWPSMVSETNRGKIEAKETMKGSK